MNTAVKNEKTINLVRVSLFIALSGVGAYLKFPSPVGSIALDSLPGYLGVLLLGASSGGIILIAGHLVSALISGFPLGAMHIVIALLMGGCGFVFDYFLKKDTFLAIAMTIICNGIILPAMLIRVLGLGFFMGITPMLLLASAVNIILAVVLYKLYLRGSLK